jgi:hypothetical protein
VGPITIAKLPKLAWQAPSAPPPPIAMPLIFTHDATATPVIPSDAAANPDTNPTPSTPVASAPFQITPLLTIGVPPSSRNIDRKTLCLRQGKGKGKQTESANCT